MLLLGQLGLDLMGELVQVLIHTLHAEPLGVEKTAVLTEKKARVQYQMLAVSHNHFLNIHFYMYL